MGARGSERGATVCEVRRHGVQRDGVRSAARRCARCGATAYEVRRRVRCCITVYGSRMTL